MAVPIAVANPNAAAGQGRLLAATNAKATSTAPGKAAGVLRALSSTRSQTSPRVITTHPSKSHRCVWRCQTHDAFAPQEEHSGASRFWPQFVQFTVRDYSPPTPTAPANMRTPTGSAISHCERTAR